MSTIKLKLSFRKPGGRESTPTDGTRIGSPRHSATGSSTHTLRTTTNVDRSAPHVDAEIRTSQLTMTADATIWSHSCRTGPNETRSAPPARPSGLPAPKTQSRSNMRMRGGSSPRALANTLPSPGALIVVIWMTITKPREDSVRRRGQTTAGGDRSLSIMPPPATGPLHDDPLRRTSPRTERKNDWIPRTGQGRTPSPVDKDYGPSRTTTQTTPRTELGETPSSVNKGDLQLTPWTEPGETPSSVDKGGTSDRTGGDPELGRQGRPTAASDRTGGDPEPGRQGRPTAE